jgi:hypothetical protein
MWLMTKQRHSHAGVVKKGLDREGVISEVAAAWLLSQATGSGGVKKRLIELTITYWVGKEPCGLKLGPTNRSGFAPHSITQVQAFNNSESVPSLMLIRGGD